MKTLTLAFILTTDSDTEINKVQRITLINDISENMTWSNDKYKDAVITKILITSMPVLLVTVKIFPLRNTNLETARTKLIK